MTGSPVSLLQSLAPRGPLSALQGVRGFRSVVRVQATCSKWSLSPSARVTLRMVAKLGLPSADSAL